MWVSQGGLPIGLTIGGHHHGTTERAGNRHRARRREVVALGVRRDARRRGSREQARRQHAQHTSRSTPHAHTTQAKPKTHLTPKLKEGRTRAYRTKSVSGPIIHSFRNGYLVLWWSSSHTRPSPHFSGREASSALMPYRSLSRSTSASVGISRSVSAIAFGHSTCR